MTIGDSEELAEIQTSCMEMSRNSLERHVSISMYVHTYVYLNTDNTTIARLFSKKSVEKKCTTHSKSHSN